MDEGPRSAAARRARPAVALASAAIVVALASAPARPGAAAGGGTGAEIVLSPVADTFVSAGERGESYGSEPVLRVGGSRGARSYLRFNLRGARRPLARALLRVYVRSGSAAGVKVVAAAGGPWSERRLTYRTAPRLSAAGPVSGPLPPRRWATIDVTPLLRRGSFSLGVLAAGSGEIAIASRETALAPKLVVGFGPAQPTLPVRAAFYYPWFPEAWKQKGIRPFTRYHPTLGTYRSTAAVFRRHLAALLYGGFDAGIASWSGRGTKTDVRLPTLLAVTRESGSTFRWAVYYEAEGRGDPSVQQLRADLTYLADRYGRDPAYLRLGGRFVVFVYGDPHDGCRLVERWKQANTVGAYLVLKVFDGYRRCASQPDGWHQYGPRTARDAQLPSSFTISPGFYKASEAGPSLERDLDRWASDVTAMVHAGAQFELVTTFNEWGEGTAVERAAEWSSASGYGGYLDVLHAEGRARPEPPPPPPPPSSGDPVIAAAGDIACDPSSGDFNGGAGTDTNCAQKATSDLLLSLHPSAVLTLGDNQYEDGSLTSYEQSFDPSWGRLKPLVRPAVGNHEYLTPRAAGYFAYFGSAAGDPGKGYYSYDLGAWHLIAVNSECGRVGGCQAGSPQELWLKRDLAAHRNRCALAYWHEPRFSSGQHGNANALATIWNDLVAAHAEIVLSGHNHVYERFEPIGRTEEESARYGDPVLDPNGIRELVVGTGGRNLSRFGAPALRGETVRSNSAFGVLELTLHPAGYDWRFVATNGNPFSDSGSARCS